ncbi:MULTISPECIES: redoxin domain-containing protein [Solibacillus]|uniref:Redoxin domain-containing protein n=1 Tax=Solibacillus faecavium TaxID=2762221 RepID=A0ABR8XVB9_9BACL|nr:redoxin domain-containing protein [Solibacillus faecavium]MBD8035890.1 redoxin domain-containing protein [Solibacillus faecavium]
MKKATQLALVIVLIIGLSYAILSNVTSGHAEAKIDHIELLTPTGQQVTIPSEGSYILNFWATYCPPCEREMPAFEAAYATLQAQNIELFAVNVEEPTKLVNRYLAQFNLSFPILLDRNGELKEVYEILTLPTTLFVKDGKVVHTVKGELSEQELLTLTKNFLY